MPVIQKATHRVFDFKNDKDPSKSTKVIWRDAKPVELAKYKSARTVILSGRSKEGMSSAQATKLASAIWDFVTNLIVGVENWEVPVVAADGTESTRELVLPADKDVLVKSFGEDVPGLAELFTNTVLTVHFPDDAASYEAAAGSSDEEETPPN